MIQFTNVSKTYSNGYQALNDISFKINAGEMVLLTGPSGSGKTSLLRLLLRLEIPSDGYVFVNKCNIAKLSRSKLPMLRRYIGMVFQHPQLLANETVYHNVALPLLVAGYKPKEVKLRTTAALQKVGLLEKSHLLAASLSSGEQKLTEIARAIATTPRILLVDEPTANVDALTAQEILKLFKAFNQIGITVIIATHQRNLLFTKQTSTLFLKDGCLNAGEQYNETENKGSRKENVE